MKNDICLSKVNVVFFVKYRFSVRLFEVILVLASYFAPRWLRLPDRLK